jgi:hypothetical protein
MASGPSSTAPRGTVKVPLWGAAAAFWAAVAAIFAARSLGLAESPVVTTLGVIFTSIVVEPCFSSSVRSSPRHEPG